MTANTLRPAVIPLEGARGVKRIALAGGVVIHHILAGQLRRDVRVGPVPPRSLLEYLRFMPVHPLQLRPHRLAGHGGPPRTPGPPLGWTTRCPPDPESRRPRILRSANRFQLLTWCRCRTGWPGVAA